MDDLITREDVLAREIQVLTNERDKYKKDYETIKNENDLVVVTVIKILKSFGLWPLTQNDNLAKKAIKAVKTIILDATLNPDSMAKRFDFVKDLYPLCEKYKDIEV